MQLLLRLTPAEDVQQHVLPMLYRGLDSDSPQIHELCLSVLPTFAGLLDHANVKNSLLPRIKKLCLSTSTLSVRVNCLLCVGKLLEHLDKWLVVDEILPFLPQIPSREPAVLMGILGIYKIAMNHKKLGISKEVLATRILPFLIPLCIENGLSLAQFGAITSLVKEMFQAVESEHRTKLQQLNSVKDEQKLLKSSMDSVPAAKPVELDGTFSALEPRQQESVKMMGSQPVVEPQRVSAPPRPKDLTASLLSDFAGNNHMPPAGGNLNSSPHLGMTFNGNAAPLSPWSGSPNTIPRPQNNQNFNGNGAPFSPWSGSPNTIPRPQHTQDWSALDNLLPSRVNNAKSPMNQMKGSSNVPLIPQPSVSSSNNNQLSKSDLLDFLS